MTTFGPPFSNFLLHHLVTLPVVKIRSRGGGVFERRKVNLRPEYATEEVSVTRRWIKIVTQMVLKVA